MARRLKVEAAFGGLVCILLLAAMGKSERYFGQLLRGWDAQFYYAAARSLAFDGDLDIRNDLARTPAPWVFTDNGRSTLPVAPDGRVLNKYPIGTSLLETVPLMFSRAVAPIVDPAADGYAPWQIRLTGAWLVFLSALSVGVTVRWLSLYESSLPVVMAAVALVLVGTSQLYYAALYPFMSHGVSALLVALVLLSAERIVRGGVTPTPLALWGALGAGLVLIRPQQATLVVLLAAALAWHGRQHPRGALAVLAAACISIATAGVVQSGANLLGVGQFRFNAYAANGEGFDFLRPDLYTVLLSPARGLLAMAPLSLMALAGALARAWRAPVLMAAVVHLFVQIWLVAAWSSPEQGDAFGGRMFVDLSPVLSLGVATALSAARRRVTALVAAGAFSFLAVGWTTVLLLVYVVDGLPRGASRDDVLYRVQQIVARVAP